MSGKIKYCGTLKLHADAISVFDNGSDRFVVMSIGGRDGFSFYDQRPEVIYELRNHPASAPLSEEFIHYFNRRVHLTIKENDGFLKIVLRRPRPTIAGFLIAAYFGVTPVDVVKKVEGNILMKNIGRSNITIHRPPILDIVRYGL